MKNRLNKVRKTLSRLSLTCSIRFILLLSKLMPYRLGVYAGGILGFIAYYIFPRERNRAIAHLTLAFGEKGRPWIRRTAHRSFIHLGKSLLEVMLISPCRLAQVVDIQGEENLRTALSLKKGVVYVTGRILDATPATLLRFSVRSTQREMQPVSGKAEDDITQTYALAESGGRTTLSIAHGDFRNLAKGEEIYPAVMAGWDTLLARFKALAEGIQAT